MRWHGCSLGIAVPAGLTPGANFLTIAAMPIHPLVPANLLRAQWRGLESLGLDMAALRQACGDPFVDATDVVPVERYLRQWAAAQALFGAPGLPTALAAALPFGALGMLDYLAGSAATLGASVESLALHVRTLIDDTWIEIEAPQGRLFWIMVRARPHVPALALEFTTALLACRLRQVVGPELLPQQVLLARGIAPTPEQHAPVFGASVRYDATACGIALLTAQRALPLRMHDPYLHDTLCTLAAQLSLPDSTRHALSAAIAARLRHLLAEQQAEPARLARLLGLSERTLQRRLEAEGLSFSDLLTRFRREEAERLLRDPAQPLSQIAQALGYSEQAAFSRAFKRWTGTTPAAWRRSGRGAASHVSRP